MHVIIGLNQISRIAKFIVVLCASKVRLSNVSWCKNYIGTSQDKPVALHS